MLMRDKSKSTYMADEKSPERNSHRHFATKQIISLENETGEPPYLKDFRITELCRRRHNSGLIAELNKFSPRFLWH